MGDLQEIRRFWPWMRECDWFGPRRAFWSRRYRGVQVVVARMDAALWAQAGWAVTFCDDRSRRRSKSDPWDGNQFFTARSHKGSTIAAAMAAAGFAQRPIGRYRETFNQYADRTQGKPVKHRAWHARRYRDKPVMPFADTCQRHDDGTVAWPVLLESRQRPRKGVRLGRRGRRLALGASIAEALDLVRQKRLDRGEIGR